jgi:hypothetical protein
MSSDNPSPVLVRDLKLGTLLRPDRRLIPWEAYLSPATVDTAMEGTE